MATAQIPGIVVVAWDQVSDASRLLREVAFELIGTHPGPVHHLCPVCGSIEHGRPYVDAPVDMSIAYSSGLSIVAVSTAGPVGVDIEDVDVAWVRREAVGKAHGVGLLVEDPGSAWVSDISIPGYVAAVATLTGPVEVRARPRRTAMA